MEDTFTGRERSRLRRARESGYLNAACQSHEAIRDAHSFWCWRLRLPVVWFERLSPRSKYGRVQVDLFTTPNVFTRQGEAELLRLACPGSISSHEASWPRVPLGQLEELARLALRATLRPSNCERSESRAARDNAPADNVLPWKIPA
uniref:Uncharacterized protein n=1 Tax=Solibacter usitatus (strain Ellin6076) TaxID=234267 RepID=Q02A13_SOLUE